MNHNAQAFERPTDKEAEETRAHLKMVSANKLALEWGVSRMAILALAAGLPMLPSTLRRIRECRGLG
jgi:hypothetical protein